MKSAVGNYIKKHDKVKIKEIEQDEPVYREKEQEAETEEIYEEK